MTMMMERGHWLSLFFWPSQTCFSVQSSLCRAIREEDLYVMCQKLCHVCTMWRSFPVIIFGQITLSSWFSSFICKSNKVSFLHFLLFSLKGLLSGRSCGMRKQEKPVGHVEGLIIFRLSPPTAFNISAMF